jgi:hypothetical protein
MNKSTTVGAWFLFVVMPFMYGIECQVAYGSRFGFWVGWSCAKPFVLWAAVMTVIGIVLEIKRAHRPKEAPCQSK